MLNLIFNSYFDANSQDILVDFLYGANKNVEQAVEDDLIEKVDLNNETFSVFGDTFANFQSLFEKNNYKNINFVNINIHPDIEYLMIQDAEDVLMSYMNYFYFYKKYSNKFINSYDDVDFDIKLNYIGFNEYNFSQYQDILKNFCHFKRIKKIPEFIDHYINDDTTDSLPVGDHSLGNINIYKHFKYTPLTYDELQNLEGQTFKLSDLKNYKKSAN